MRALITGAAGLVGSALAEAYDDVVALRHRGLDITDAGAVDSVVETVQPDVIFNCAVIGVDQCEAAPALAELVNVDGPVNLARAAEKSARDSCTSVRTTSSMARVARGRTRLMMKRGRSTCTE